VAFIAGSTRLSSFAGEPSGATVTIEITPEFAAAAEAIPKGRALEITELFCTVIWAVPG
jgi:hypothetical protein